MKGQARKYKLSIIWVSLAFIFIISLVAGGRALKTLQNPQTVPQVDNMTKAFEVIGLRREDHRYLLELKNVSGKPINGYAIGTSRRLTITSDLTSGDRVINPEERTEIQIPLSQLDVLNGGSAQQGRITILAVTFEDRSSEGDAHTLREIRDRRLGIKEQLNRMIHLLESAIASPDSNSSTALNRLKSQISALTDEPNNNAPPFVSAGKRNVNEDVLLEIQKLEASGNIGEGLKKLSDQSKKRAGRL